MAVFVRVRDKKTGHEYDVVEPNFDPEHQTKVPGYPTSPHARPAKHRTDLAGRPVPRRKPKPSGRARTASRPAAPEKE